MIVVKARRLKIEIEQILHKENFLGQNAKKKLMILGILIRGPKTFQEA
jgi:hypothetical protein